MCGILGLITNKPEPEDLIDNLNNLMIHRGPDCQKTQSIDFDEKKAYIGHCRLSVIDLSDNGNQPMWSDDGKKVIVFNGEVYNFKTLKKELEKCGYSFKTNSDTETVLKAYEKWGEKSVDKLNGMFAFAVVDTQKNKIFLARDRFGKKPLYYCLKDEKFMFASELKPFLMYNGIEKRINKKAMGFYMRFGYIPTPYSIIEGIKKLPQGSYAVYKNDSLALQKYWDVNKKAVEGLNDTIKDFDTAKSMLEAAITSAVEDRLVSDVPMGVLLSSGIDSTTVASIAQKNSANRINTYTIGVNDERYNEAQTAKKIAEIIGTSHHEYYMNEEDMMACIDNVPCFFDEPFADTSMIPNMMLSKIVRQDITVAIGGDGGDEVFCGYPHYILETKAQKYDRIGGIIHTVLPANIRKKLPTQIRRIEENRDARTKCQIILPDDLEEVKQSLKYPYDEPLYPVEDKMGIKDWQFRRMVLDMQTSLVDDMLVKADRASMSASLEVRSPLLDYRVAELSFRLPQKFKCNGNVQKYILRQLAYQYVPQEILDAPKRGFCIPLEKWLNEKKYKELFYAFADRAFLEEQDIFDYDFIKKAIDSFYAGDMSKFNICWYFLVFQLWYDKYNKYISK